MSQPDTGIPVGPAIPIREKPEPAKVYVAKVLTEDTIVRNDLGSWVGLTGDYVIYLNNRIVQVMNPELFADRYIRTGGVQ
jgi:hypothetical protein